MMSEVDAIRERYEKRKRIAKSRYSPLNPIVSVVVQERRAAMIKLLARQGILDLSALKILEVGCGSGTNLLELLQLGALPENLVGNELLSNRFNVAEGRLPNAIRLLQGDASKLDLPDCSFDIVYQSTVFTSILDDELQVALAANMWRMVRPGGGVLWYDFIYNNPNNPDVRGVPFARIKSLFPRGEITKWRITLAPPIARRIPPFLYPWINFPFLRTHVLCYIKKV